jgi:hypothetical protein
MSSPVDLRFASRTLIICLTLLAFAAALSLGSAEAASVKTCGELGRVGEVGPEIVTVRAKGGVGCASARRVLRKSHRGQRLTGVGV